MNGIFHDTLPLKQLSWLFERLYSNMRVLEVRTCNYLSLSHSLSLQLSFVTPVTPVSTGNKTEAEAENENCWDTVECETQVCVCAWNVNEQGLRYEKQAVSHACKCARPILLGSGPFSHSAAHICGHVGANVSVARSISLTPVWAAPPV